MKPLRYNPVTVFEELKLLSELQSKEWTAEIMTSPAHMKAAVMHGGCVIAAYDDRQAVGFCYGFPAFARHQSYLHSHMMVVHPDYRNRGIGMQLKLEQRRWAIHYGYSVITWTFDPVQTRNAYLNLCKLGGTISDYLPSVYGVDSLNNPADRLLVQWDLLSPDVCAAVDGKRRFAEHWNHYPVLNGPENSVTAEGWGSAGYLLSVPNDLEAEKQALWKQQFRSCCEEAFSHSCRIIGFIPCHSSESYYVLEFAEGESHVD